MNRKIPGPEGQKRLTRAEYIRAFTGHFISIGGESVKEAGKHLECTVDGGAWGHTLNPEFFSDYWARRGARFTFDEARK